MGFFQTVADGYQIMGDQLKLGWQKHGAQILTGSGTGLMLIASIFMAKKGSSAEVQQAIAEADAVIAEIEAEKAAAAANQTAATASEGENAVISAPEEDKKVERSRKFRLAKAKGKKLWTVGKHFLKEIAVEGVGAGLVAFGQHKNTEDKRLLSATIAETSLAFAAYRANVIADQGEEKDLEYFTTKTAPGAKKVKAKDGTTSEEPAGEGGDVVVQADPNAYRFWFSPETCPGRYYDNLDMTINELEFIEDTLTRKLRMTGHLYLNDMRREFGGLTPDKMDVPIGGIMGLTFDKSKPETLRYIDLGWRKDKDFLEGRKTGVWIIFPCDPTPIMSKIKPEMVSMECPAK